LNLLNNKRKRSNENNKALNSEDEEDNFQILLLQSNLRIREVKGDGNCLFRAVSDQVYGTDQYYELIREKCMDYLVIMRKFFEPYIGEDFDDYIKEKRKDKTWGDDIEIEALSEIYNRPIEIYKGSNKPLKSFHENKYFSQYDTNTNINFSLHPIRLSYHNKNHYNSIIPIDTDVVNYRKYKDSLIKSKPGYFESKMIKNAEDNEAELEKGIQVSNDFFLRLKNNLSEKIEDIANKNYLSEEDEEEHDENIKSKKIKKEESKEKNEEKIYKINKIDKEKEIKNKNVENNDTDNDNFLSNSTIKSAVELGYDIEDAIDAWCIYGDNKELVINYLLNKNNNIN
jgi:OTU domain-containing protein 5